MTQQERNLADLLQTLCLRSAASQIWDSGAKRLASPGELSDFVAKGDADLSYFHHEDALSDWSRVEDALRASLIAGYVSFAQNQTWWKISEISSLVSRGRPMRPVDRSLDEDGDLVSPLIEFLGRAPSGMRSGAVSLASSRLTQLAAWQWDATLGVLADARLIVGSVGGGNGVGRALADIDCVLEFLLWLASFLETNGKVVNFAYCVRSYFQEPLVRLATRRNELLMCARVMGNWEPESPHLLTAVKSHAADVSRSVQALLSDSDPSGGERGRTLPGFGGGH